VKIHSTRVLINNELVEATVSMENGKIEHIELGKSNMEELVSYGNDVIMPGLIDSHVHINEPGRTAWEGFNTATRAAAAGGITTLVDMPLNSSPVTIDSASFDIKTKAAKDNLHVNCGFWGGLVPENADNMQELIDTGVLGIKAFLTHSGIDEFPNVIEADLRKAMPVIARNNLPLLVHCELDNDHPGLLTLKNNPDSYQAYLNSRPKDWENKAIKLMISLAEAFDCHVHIVHLCSADLVHLIQEKRKQGVKLTVETCPHYLVLNAEQIPDGQPIYKCAPPIREKANNELLWKAVEKEVIDFIVTDHSPATPELKKLESGNYKEAWGGISSLQHSLPLIWTSMQKRNYKVSDTARLMSEHVAKFLNLEHKKSKVAIGYDADITIWSPEEKFTVKQEALQYKNKITPYLGMALNGVVKQTYVGGSLVYNQGEFEQLNKGKIIKRID
jgi:allantoinase